MDTSIFLARLIGPLYLVVGLGLLLNQSYYREMLRSLPTGGTFSYIAGLLALIASLAILQVHNLWVSDWRVILTLFGWLGLAKGVLLLVFPLTGQRIAAWFSKSSTILVAGVFALLLGNWLCYMGYAT